jgi:alcohol dehydrogenase
VVDSFLFSSTPSLNFGIGKRKELPQVLQKYGRNGLIITGSGSFKKSEFGRRLLEEIEKTQAESWFATIPGEPTPEMVDGIVAEHRNKKIDFVVAIGGGSVLDGGKAVSAMLHKNESVTEYLEGVGTRQPDGLKVPFIAGP